MAIHIVEKISDHTAHIKNVATVLWRVRPITSIDEYYVYAVKVHAKLGGGFWVDSKDLIALNKVQIAQPFEMHSVPQEAGVYIDFTCGQCGIVNTINQAMLQKSQGAHFCKACKSTIAIVTGKHLQTKHGTLVGNRVTVR